MKKSFFVTACAVVFSVPLIALAAFTRPSEVLTFLMNTEGRPRDFNVKMYAQAIEDDGTPIRLFATIGGSTEGATAENMKMTMHADVTAEFTQGTLKTGIDLLLHRQKLYGRMTRIDVSGQGMEDASALDAVNAQYVNKWFSLDASPEASASGNFWQDLAENSDIPVTPDEMRAAVNQLLDAVFALEIDRYHTGHAYLLTQKPHAVTEAVRVLSELQPMIEDQLATMELLADPDLQDLENEINRTLQVRMKVDVSNEGTFQFARFYMTFALPEENDFSFSFEGSLQSRTRPVHLDIPQNTETLDEVLGDFFLPIPGMSNESMPDDVWTIPKETPDLSTSARPVPLSAPSTSCSPNGSVRGIDLGTQELCPGGRESRRSMLRRLEHY